jgi:hypothetical protein
MCAHCAVLQSKGNDSPLPMHRGATSQGIPHIATHIMSQFSRTRMQTCACAVQGRQSGGPVCLSWWRRSWLGDSLSLSLPTHTHTHTHTLSLSMCGGSAHPYAPRPTVLILAYPSIESAGCCDGMTVFFAATREVGGWGGIHCIVSCVRACVCVNNCGVVCSYHSGVSARARCLAGTSSHTTHPYGPACTTLHTVSEHPTVTVLSKTRLASKVDNSCAHAKSVTPTSFSQRDWLAKASWTGKLESGGKVGVRGGFLGCLSR